jgi:hypothetical protein
MQVGIGICKAGIRFCDPMGLWGPCFDEVLPTNEICGNGQDDDCDGVIDGGCGSGQCAVATDCMGQDTECGWRTCDAGICGIAYAGPGAPLMNQTPGDCRLAVCDGNGNETWKPADDDLPPPKPCVIGQCSNGAFDYTLAAPGTSCGTNLVCDEFGGCMPPPPQCVQASDCGGAGDFHCAAWVCTLGSCEIELYDDGTPCPGGFVGCTNGLCM